VNAFKRGKHGNHSIYVPTRSGRPVQRSTGTNVPSVVRGMKRMVVQFKDEHRWTLLAAIASKKLTLRDAYTAHTSNSVDALEQRLAAVNLCDHLDGWIAWVRAERDAEARTADVYWQQVTTLIVPKGEFAASDLTQAKVMTWLTSREKASSGTRRKYLYALKSFIRYARAMGALKADPLAGLKAPKKNKARERWVSEDIDRAIVAAASSQYRALYAFIKATGCDVGSARRAQVGDVSLKALTADIRGTKTDRRKVHAASIEAWAVPILTEHLKTRVGRHTPLFDPFTNSGASHHHATCCKAVNVEDYTLKDSRHSVAVRMRLKGRSFEDIASQLGTSVFQAVTVYSQYKPEQLEQATSNG
jgi:integrase